MRITFLSSFPFYLSLSRQLEVLCEAFTEVLCLALWKLKFLSEISSSDFLILWQYISLPITLWMLKTCDKLIPLTKAIPEIFWPNLPWFWSLKNWRMLSTMKLGMFVSTIYLYPEWSLNCSLKKLQSFCLFVWPVFLTHFWNCTSFSVHSWMTLSWCSWFMM